MMDTLLNPVLALIVWSLLIWVLMYARRIPAMQEAKIDPQDARHPGSLSSLPSSARSAADNYNHLHEQPTLFYALCFYAHLSGAASPLMIAVAWAYVIGRVIHSLVQVTVNLVMVRFSVFCLTSFVLMAMAGLAIANL